MIKRRYSRFHEPLGIGLCSCVGESVQLAVQVCICFLAYSFRDALDEVAFPL
jgi:hypothetical protein